NSVITYANPAVETLFGHPAQSLIGQSLATLQAPQQRAHHLKGMQDYLATGTRHVNWRGAGVQGLHADGTVFPLEVAFSEAQIDGQRMFIGFMRDITERKRANDLITNQNRILKMISAGAPLAETLEAIRHMVEQLSGNPRCSIQALREDEGGMAAEISLSLPASFRRAVLEQFSQVRVNVAGATVQENAPLALLDFISDASLSDCREAATENGFAAASVWPLFGRQGQLLATVAQYFRRPRGPSAWETALLPAALELATLAIENKRADERILRLAHSDELTGLPNRARFLQDLTHALARAARSGKQVGLLFMDLDRFKNINDTLGHDAGDRVLCEVARRLREVVRDADLVARLGGDEFVVVAENCSGTAALTGIAQKLLDRIAQSIDIDKQQFHLSASIGISVYPDDGKDIHALIKNADVAMYRVKETGRNGYQFYAEQMSAGSLERMVLESGLRHAIEQQQLVLHYQPKLDLLTGQVTGVEALVRWQHPDMGLLGPIKFISLAEETGLIVPMGRWVLQAACRQIQQWQILGIRPPRVAVNLSARQFRHEKLYDDVDTALREHGLTPEALELEVTESLVMDNPEHAVTLLNRFKAAGLHLAMDDFGTGYSSLGNLKRFPFDSVKVDRSFVRDLAFDPNDAAISRAIIAMAHALRLRVVAEGVETVAQLDFLREHGCDEIQGYYFARPMSAEALTEFLRTHRDVAVVDLAGGK
ncbi:MAG: EAL domain-containing protein, partial [Pseudomonadota bacterium]|nr:EAL domain-containing protein [Pseudomonadota bacterium]